MPKVSAVLLVYNVASYLPRALESLVNQTLDDVEIICVDDASTDASPVILREYARRYPQIRIITSETNVGGATAGNRGLREATGDYLTIMDGDDFRPLDAFERLYAAAQRERADLVVGRGSKFQDGRVSEVVYKYERELWRHPRVFQPGDLTARAELFWDAFYWNKLYARELVQQRGAMMPEGFVYADSPMVLAAYLGATRVAVIPDLVYCWRRRDAADVSSITQQTHSRAGMEARMRTLEYCLTWLRENHTEELAQAWLSRWIDRLLFLGFGQWSAEDFANVYLAGTRRWLGELADPHANEFSIARNLMIHFILADDAAGLRQVLGARLRGAVDGLTWHNQFYADAAIPRERFSIKVNEPDTFAIAGASSSRKGVELRGLRLPEPQPITGVNLVLLNRQDITDEHAYPFGHDTDGWSIFVPAAELAQLPPSDFEAHLEIVQAGKSERFRLSSRWLLTPAGGAPLFTHAGSEFMSLCTLAYQHYQLALTDDRLLVTGRNFDTVEIAMQERSGSRPVQLQLGAGGPQLAYAQFIDEAFANWRIIFNVAGRAIPAAASFVDFDPEPAKLGHTRLALAADPKGVVQLRVAPRGVDLVTVARRLKRGG
ncbi:MAG: glycosyltransferase [Propionibacteriaceae bacterium]|nr:glycosyltransferase [Propionibacteriaceae bacterium]